MNAAKVCCYDLHNRFRDRIRTAFLKDGLGAVLNSRYYNIAKKEFNEVENWFTIPYEILKSCGLINLSLNLNPVEAMREYFKDMLTMGNIFCKEEVKLLNKVFTGDEKSQFTYFIQDDLISRYGDMMCICKEISYHIIAAISQRPDLMLPFRGNNDKDIMKILFNNKETFIFRKVEESLESNIILAKRCFAQYTFYLSDKYFNGENLNDYVKGIIKSMVIAGLNQTMFISSDINTFNILRYLLDKAGCLTSTLLLSASDSNDARYIRNLESFSRSWYKKSIIDYVSDIYLDGNVYCSGKTAIYGNVDQTTITVSIPTGRYITTPKNYEKIKVKRNIRIVVDNNMVKLMAGDTDIWNMLFGTTKPVDGCWLNLTDSNKR